MRKMLFSIALLVIIAGCKKPKQVDDNIAGTKGDLLLSRSWFTSFTDSSKSDEKFEYALANFLKDVNYKDAGAIKYGNSALELNTVTNGYLTAGHDISLPDFTHALDGNQQWTVSGSAANGIPTFAAQAPAYPSFLLKNFDSIPVVHKSQPYTISWNASAPCDSISVGLYQNYNIVQSGVVAGNISSFTFSPSQLSIFENFTPAYIIIEGWNYKNIVVSPIPVKVESYSRRNCNAKIID